MIKIFNLLGAKLQHNGQRKDNNAAWEELTARTFEQCQIILWMDRS